MSSTIYDKLIYSKNGKLLGNATVKEIPLTQSQQAMLTIGKMKRAAGGVNPYDEYGKFRYTRGKNGGFCQLQVLDFKPVSPNPNEKPMPSKADKPEPRIQQHTAAAAAEATTSQTDKLMTIHKLMKRCASSN